MAWTALMVQVLKLIKVFAVRLLLFKPFFSFSQTVIAALCSLQQFAWVLTLYTKKQLSLSGNSKNSGNFISLATVDKHLKKASPLVLRTVKRAKKGVQTTAKLCKKVQGDLEEPLVMAWYFVLRLFASIALKGGKQMIRKRRLPRFNFLKKHFSRAACYFTVLPALLLLLIRHTGHVGELKVLSIMALWALSIY